MIAILLTFVVPLCGALINGFIGHMFKKAAGPMEGDRSRLTSASFMTTM